MMFVAQMRDISGDDDDGSAVREAMESTDQIMANTTVSRSTAVDTTRAATQFVDAFLFRLRNGHVGKLDNPQRYDRRSIAVYKNSLGYYFTVDGKRHRISNQLWTTESMNVPNCGWGAWKLRGKTVMWPVGETAVESAVLPAAVSPGTLNEDVTDAEARDIEAAIAASLEDSSPAMMMMGEQSTPAIPATVTAVPISTSSTSTLHLCHICYDEPSSMLMKPCNHVSICHTCALRHHSSIVRHPCGICRVLVRKMERVYLS